MRLMLAALLALFVTGCDSLVGPKFRAGDVIAIEAPPQFTLWWSLVEQCSGRRGSLPAVHFYRTRTPTLTVDGKQYAGFWWSDGNRVVLTNPDDGATVRH